MCAMILISHHHHHQRRLMLFYRACRDGRRKGIGNKVVISDGKALSLASLHWEGEKRLYLCLHPALPRQAFFDRQ